jgi:hypothetical protein
MRSTYSTFVTRGLTAILLGGAILASSSCGEARTGEGPTFAIIDLIEGASGAAPEEFATNVRSDVQTLVDTEINGQTVKSPTIFNDLGRATLRLGVKNPGFTNPTSINDVTLTRYRVVFLRSDGRNTPGVDVPHSFDGAVTVTLCGCGGTATVGFDVVRWQHKMEPPLRNLIGGGAANFISTIAEITFFGRDQAGNEVSVTGSISVHFGDFADPD